MNKANLIHLFLNLLTKDLTVYILLYAIQHIQNFGFKKMHVLEKQF